VCIVKKGGDERSFGTHVLVQEVDEIDLECMAKMSFSNYMDRKDVMGNIFISYILGLSVKIQATFLYETVVIS
jgi:hypothetical protein